MQLFGAHEDANPTRTMPGDPPLPLGTTNPRVDAEYFAACTTTAKSDDNNIRNGDVPSSPPKRLTADHGHSPASRKRSRSNSTRASAGDRDWDQDSRRCDPRDASQPSTWMLGQPLSEPSHSDPAASTDTLRKAASVLGATRPDGHREPAFDSLRMLGDQALLSAEQFLQQHPPLQLVATAGGEYVSYEQAVLSPVQVGFGCGPMHLPTLYPIRAVPAPAYPYYNAWSLSSLNAMGHESSVSNCLVTGGVDRGLAFATSGSHGLAFAASGSHGLPLHPALHAPHPYAHERLSAPPVLVFGTVNTPSNVGMHRRTSQESTIEVHRPAGHAKGPQPEAPPGKSYCSLFNAPTPTMIESVKSPPSSSTTSYSGEVLVPRHPARITSGNQHIVSSVVRRPPVSLGIDEDVNWLSEFHCYVRCELVEVFQADRRDCKVRNFNVAHEQVGIRCKFCAHRPTRARALRSAAYPSSICQIYQSFTMMLRDHFPNCDALPRDARNKFMTFREIPAQGATDSKRYWIYAAKKLGMVDSSNGIQIGESLLASEQDVPPFGTPLDASLTEATSSEVSLADERDRHIASDFLILLMQQARVVHLMASERLGSRRNLPENLVGFACRYCCVKRRLGLCRMFPSRRRTLPGKVSDLYDHLQRCFLCPASVKQELVARRDAYEVDPERDELFFDRVWRRLGHDS